MGQKIAQLKRRCPNCEHQLTEIGHQDNHGAYSPLEIHCSRSSGGCGYAEDAEGEVRNEGVLFSSTRSKGKE